MKKILDKYSLYCEISKRKNDKYSFRELAEYDLGYFKMSKTNPEIANKCCEDWTKAYREGKKVTSLNGHGLSFVPSFAVICCIPYGNQLTEFIFDQCYIIDCDYELKPSAIPEFVGLDLLVKRNYPLSNPETLVKIIKMSHNKFLSIAVNNKSKYMNISEHLKRFEYFETLSFWEYCTKNIVNVPYAEAYVDVIKNVENIFEEWKSDILLSK